MRDELLAAMAHLHHRHAGVVPVDQLPLRLLEHLDRHRRRPRAEVEDARCGLNAACCRCRRRRLGRWRCRCRASRCRCRCRSRHFRRRDPGCVCRPESFSPSSRLMSVTPCVERPISRISFTRVRISTPPEVISMISSSARTSVAATTLPLRSRGLDRDHALRAAAVARVLGDRRALAVAVLGGGQHALLSRSPPPAARSPCRPWRGSCRARRARRGPSARTSFSSKRTALPSSENSITSCLPSVSATPIEEVALVQVDGDDAGGARVARSRTATSSSPCLPAVAKNT